MKFSIITTTFKQQELLLRAVTSLQAQTYKDWEMIIVNDSPKDIAYREFATLINDPRIHYFVNESNRGSNYSKNFALDRLSADSRWVIFLDDGDYLSPDTLTIFSERIMLHGDTKWFITNHALKNGTSLTRFPHDETSYSYALNCLFLRRGSIATHCIETKLITHIHASFSKYVKQGEEWFFFYQIRLHTKMYYSDHNSTISDGYDVGSGLNFRKRSFRERYETLAKLFYEASARKLIRAPFIVYMMMRCIRLIIR